MDEQRAAAETLARVRADQERTRRAARVPWWMYVVMFVLAAGFVAANDFVDRGGGKFVAVVVLVLLAVVLVMGFAGGSAPLSRIRGVQRRQPFNPRIFGTMLVVVGVGAWLVSRYGTELAHEAAEAVGLGAYPNTVAGVLYGAAFTALFAVEQLLFASAERRRNR